MPNLETKPLADKIVSFLKNLAIEDSYKDNLSTESRLKLKELLKELNIK
jgi:hypothetical protein